MKKTDLLVWLLLCGLAVAAAFALKQCHRTLPESQCSEVYRRYAHVEGVEAAFVKGFPINDTLGVDVTLLRATDSAGWAFMIDAFGLPTEVLETVKESSEFNIWVWRSPKNEPEKRIILSSQNKDSILEIVVISFAEHQIGIFHSGSKEEEDAIMNYNLDRTTNKITSNL
ncbi:MAG: hypothetical protein IKG81_15910 [Bacteroidales bacterium]|nr:hypothetical protein [Bacteroidales bacterium]